MALTISPSYCPQNHRCPIVNVCPVDAISQNGFGLPIIDDIKCKECGKCMKYCPMHAVIEKS